MEKFEKIKPCATSTVTSCALTDLRCTLCRSFSAQRRGARRKIHYKNSPYLPPLPLHTNTHTARCWVSGFIQFSLVSWLCFYLNFITSLTIAVSLAHACARSCARIFYKGTRHAKFSSCPTVDYKTHNTPGRTTGSDRSRP